MDHLKSALQFLTLLLLGKSETFDTRGMTPYFPLAGMIVGVLVSIFDKIALLFWLIPAVAAMDVVFLAILTGAFHLEGLGDAADGLLGHRPREKVLGIMKDSRIGAMGLMAVFCCLFIKWAGIQSLDIHQPHPDPYPDSGLFPIRNAVWHAISSLRQIRRYRPGFFPERP